MPGRPIPTCHASADPQNAMTAGVGSEAASFWMIQHLASRLEFCPSARLEWYECEPIAALDDMTACELVQCGRRRELIDFLLRVINADARLR